MAALTGKVLVAQGGGPTSVINESLVGAVLEARKFPQVTRVYGAIHGVRGIINEDFLDLTQETTHNLEQVAKTPSSALLATRDKPDEDYCREMFKVMRLHDVRYFFYIGGNDSADTVRIVNEEAGRVGFEFRAIHIPKTIDNDLPVNDHSPGYGSAARFVACAFMGINLDNRALPGIYIGVVMGRNAGFLTAASVLARRYPDDAPHLIYLPERPFTMERFIKDVRSVYKKYGRCVAAVSEGVQDESGTTVIETLMKRRKVKLEKDPHGNTQLSGSGLLADALASEVQKKLHVSRVRADTFGYLQRSFIECISDVDQHEAREVGEKAAHFAIWHNRDGSVIIQRTGTYSVDYHLTPLEKIAGRTRHMPGKFINRSGNDVTDAFYQYVRPLIGSGLAVPDRIRAPHVEKLYYNDHKPRSSDSQRRHKE